MLRFRIPVKLLIGSKWRLNSTPTTSPSHYRRSEFFYTLYPSGVCVQVISEPPSAFALPADEDAMRNLVRRTIDHDSNRSFSSSPCIVPFRSKSALSFKIPYPYSIDDYAPNEAIFVQRPYSLIGSIDLYPAFVLYMLSVLFGSLPMYTLLQQWQRNSRFYRRLRIKEKDDEYHNHVYYRPAGAGAGAGILGANPSSFKSASYTQLDGPQLYTHATICGLLSMTGMILACVNITLLRNSLTWNLERGAPDVDNVWKEDVGMAIAWSATACVILPAMIMLLRLLVILAYRQGWVPRYFAELL